MTPPPLTAHRPPAAGLLSPLSPARRLALQALLVGLGTLALWASAKVQVPFWPVPMTLQTLVVLLIGAGFGWRLGALTVIAYLAEGAVGLPVFAGTPEKGLGLAYMVGPTAGYLLGFVGAAALAGAVTQATRRPLPVVLGMVATVPVILVPGVLWIAFGLGAGLEAAIAGGAVPFLAGDALKAVLAAALVVAGDRLMRR